jgi:hypothetical protein
MLRALQGSGGTSVPMLGLSVVSKNPADRVLDDDTVKYVWQVLRQNLTAHGVPGGGHGVGSVAA